MFVEVHLIQNFAPSNLNRDDTNNPKDCVFGGVRRARISSQCLKRAIRFDPHFEQVSGIPVSQRTRLMADEISNILQREGLNSESAREKANEFSKHYSSKKGKLDDDNRTNVMLFISDAEVEDIAGLIKDAELGDIKKIAEDFAKANSDHPGAPDIAMFGRMLADRPETNIDAACQVAHAISTHSVNMDIDFFTAIDDLQAEGETGAGMMGVSGFNSACFYRYASIDFTQLQKNLNNDLDLARKSIEAFLYASVFAIPSGKQNSFAAHNLPSFFLAIVRENGACWSLANAFEKPVSNQSHKGLIQASAEALDSYWGAMTQFYGENGIPVMAYFENGQQLNHLQAYKVDSLIEWVEAVIQQLPRE